MWRCLSARELGVASPMQLRSRLAEEATSSPMHPFNRVDSHAAHRGETITCLEVDPQSQRFLLSGGNDGAISVFDLEQRSTSKIKPLGRLRHDTTSLSGCSSLSWFPPDNGIFLTAGYNGVLNVWDTESSIGSVGGQRPVASHLLGRLSEWGTRVCGWQGVFRECLPGLAALLFSPLLSSSLLSSSLLFSSLLFSPLLSSPRLSSTPLLHSYLLLANPASRICSPRHRPK